ncbi:MAG: SelB C-terminal domain-containing protein, partial [Pseudomonadales bacterium]
LLPSLEFGLSLDEFLASRNLKSHSLNYIYRELEQSGVNFEKLNVKFAINPWLMDGKVYAQHRARILEQLHRFHEQFPAQPGISESALNTQAEFAGSHLILNAILTRLLADGTVHLSGTNLHLPGHRAQLSEEEQQFLATIRPLLEKAGQLPPRTRELEEQTGIPLRRLESILKQAARNGHLIQVAANRFFLPETIVELATLAENLAREIPDDEGFTVIGYRDRSGLGRNLCIEILEYFDGIGFTRRNGNQRFLRTAKENIFTRE